MKKILYITVQNPFSSSTGGEQRSALICRALCKSANVDVVCFSQDKVIPQNIETDRCSLIYSEDINKVRLPYSTPIQKLNNGLKRILRVGSMYFIEASDSRYTSIINKILSEKEYDFIFVRYINTALKCSLKLDKKVLIDVDDLPEQVFLSLAGRTNNVIKKLFYLFTSRVARIHTRSILKKVKCGFLPNRKQCVYPNSLYLPNIPFPIKESENIENISEEPYTVLFVGYMSYEPNYSGVDYFIDNIWKAIKKEIPQAKFRIVGKGLSDYLKSKWEKIDGVEVLGFIPDIISEYKRCRVVVSPIYQGAGTNIKVIEAMYMSKACVISKQAAKGFDDVLINGENILIVENAPDFKNAVIGLLTDSEKCAQLKENAKKAISKEYSYDAFSELINSQIV